MCSWSSCQRQCLKMSNMLIYVYQICPHAPWWSRPSELGSVGGDLGRVVRKEGNSPIFRSAWKAWLNLPTAVIFWGSLEKNCRGDICSPPLAIRWGKCNALKAIGGFWGHLCPSQTPDHIWEAQRTPAGWFCITVLLLGNRISFIDRALLNNQFDFLTCFVRNSCYFQSTLQKR